MKQIDNSHICGECNGDGIGCSEYCKPCNGSGIVGARAMGYPKMLSWYELLRGVVERKRAKVKAMEGLVKSLNLDYMTKNGFVQFDSRKMKVEKTTLMNWVGDKCDAMRAEEISKEIDARHEAEESARHEWPKGMHWNGSYNRY